MDQAGPLQCVQGVGGGTLGFDLVADLLHGPVALPLRAVLARLGAAYPSTAASLPPSTNPVHYRCCQWRPQLPPASTRQAGARPAGRLGDDLGTLRPCDLRVRRRGSTWRAAHHMAAHRHALGLSPALNAANAATRTRLGSRRASMGGAGGRGPVVPACAAPTTRQSARDRSASNDASPASVPPAPPVRRSQQPRC